MTNKFTASEVRRTAAAIEGKQMLVSSMLRAFADLLEAREKAVPVAYAEFADNGCVRMWSRGYEERLPGTRMVPLYTHPAPADAERLAEALREFDGAFHKELADLTRIPEDDRGRIYRPFAMDCVVGLRRCWDKLSTSRNANSAQAQPPAASVTDAMEGRAQDCLHDKGKDIGYYHMRAALEAALAAQENPHA